MMKYVFLLTLLVTFGCGPGTKPTPPEGFEIPDVPKSDRGNSNPADGLTRE